MFLSFVHNGLIKLFPTDFCRTRENTSIKVFRAKCLAYSYPLSLHNI